MTVGSFGGGQEEKTMHSVEVTLRSAYSGEEVLLEALEVDVISKEKIPLLPVSLKKYEDDGLKLANGLSISTVCREIGILV